jgi:large subunit ribosomal protein L18
LFKRPDRNKLRLKKHLKVRKKITGCSERPRLCVFRSTKHIYAQIVDDTKGNTLVAASSVEPAFKAKYSDGGNVERAKEVGKLVAEKALAQGIKNVVFDRGGYIYHGRVAALAEGARESGLEF